MSTNGPPNEINDLGDFIDAAVLGDLSELIEPDDLSYIRGLGLDIEFTDDDLAVFTTSLNDVFDDSSKNDGISSTVPTIYSVPNSSVPYNPFYATQDLGGTINPLKNTPDNIAIPSVSPSGSSSTSSPVFSPISPPSSPPTSSVSPVTPELPFCFSFYLGEMSNNTSTNSTINSSTSPSPLIFNFDKKSKKRRRSQSLFEEHEETLDEIDIKVLFVIKSLKDRHGKVDDDNLMASLKIDQATLYASKERLRQIGYLPKQGKWWHKITDKGKKYMEDLIAERKQPQVECKQKKSRISL